MNLTDFFAAQLDREFAISRRVLARVPEGEADWKPHEKSMALGYLATLVATMPAWIAMEVTQNELDIRPKDGAGFKSEPWRTNAELLAQFEAAAAQACQAIASTSDEFLATPWKLLAGGKVVDERPRREVIADTLCHAAHHRGQLTVYLRLLGAAVPSIYGPSADERVF
jgi:uncharacterized damage-inducible protein DinB